MMIQNEVAPVFTAMAGLFAAMLSSTQSALACQSQFDGPGNPLRTLQAQTQTVDFQAPAGIPEAKSNRSFAAAANSPVSAVPAGIQLSLQPMSGPDTYLEQEVPAIHVTGDCRELNAIGRKTANATSRTSGWIMDRQIRPASHNESTTLASEQANTPFAGPASLNISESVRQIAIATAVSMFGCVLFVFGAKFFRRNGTATKTETFGAIVEQIIQLGNKSTLRLVRIGRQQVLVAADSGGIRSVTAVQPDFDSLIDEDKSTEQDASDIQAALSGYFQSLQKDWANKAD